MKNKQVQIIDYSKASVDEISNQIKKDHQDDVKEYNNEQNALCKVVIASILLFIGILFLFLSFKRVKNKMSGIDVFSLQFYVFVICLIIGGILLTVGVIKFTKSRKIRIKLQKEIAVLGNLRKTVMNNNLELGKEREEN